MSDMIYLNFPAVMGDARQSASFKARYGTPADLHSKITDLQRKATALKLEIQREKQKRQAAERELAAQRPSVENLLARLWAQVSGVKL